MERRVFVAILLSFAVLYGYQALFVPPQKPAVNVVEPKERPAQTAPQATPQVVEQPPAEAEPAAKVSDSAEREIVVETSTSEVVLTNRGGRVLHWQLKDYRDAQGKASRSRAVKCARGSTEAVHARR
jgi:YidC/Oxa1 family membrane protein insertase